jgi:predicted DNA-binding ribbon-helix-helix protein
MEEARTEEALTEHPEKKVLTVTKYANTHFVNVMVEKPFYIQLERMAEKMGTTPDVIISKILLKGLKELEGRL